MELRFIDPNLLRPTEQHDETAVERLFTDICRDSFWRSALLVHTKHLAILDGHHRSKVALRLGLDMVPCLLVTYTSDTIELASWRPDFRPKPEDVINAALTGHLLPVKTTRHRMKGPLPEFAIPLQLLSPKE